jgi:undecaprenyl diphosphate synthase
MTLTHAKPRDHARAAGLDPLHLPKHVAIIMDGNGRWAKARTWDRTRGHQQGADVVRAITTESVKLGIARLTLYAFSSENWIRPQREIDFLMSLLDRFLIGELPTLHDNDVRLEAIGSLHRLPTNVRTTLEHTIRATADNRSMVLSLALSYGGRDELTDACRAIAAEVAAGRLAPQEITPETVQAHLYAPGAPDVDVVIRTAGEQRLSNFLPWQATYAEYVSVLPLWPDFDIAAYHAALHEYQARERRFGGV